MTSSMQGATCRYRKWAGASCSEEPREGVARDDRLRDGAAEGHHCEAAVLELLEAHLLLALLVLWQELHPEAVVARRLERAKLVDLLRAAELNDGDPEEDLEVHANGSVELVVRVDGQRA